MDTYSAISVYLRLSRAAPIKRTAVERQVNIHIVFLFVFLLALSIGSTIGSSIRQVSKMSGTIADWHADDVAGLVVLL